MSEVGDACQIVLISGRMIAASAQLTLKMAMLTMKVYNSLYLGKWKGSTSFARFRAIKGEDYEFINVCSENPEKLAAIEKEMEAHNLLFARLPDLCGGDGNTQYVIARSDLHIFAAFLMDHTHGPHKEIKAGPISESDYAKTAVHPESGEYTKEFTDLNESARETYQERLLLPEPSARQRAGLLPMHTAKVQGETERSEVISDEEPAALMVTRGGIREEMTFQDLYMDPQIKWREAILHAGDALEPIFEDPIREGEKWAAFPVHDGEQVVIIPKEDLLSGNTIREKQFRSIPYEQPPKAMLHTTKNYVVVDVRSGQMQVLKGLDIKTLLNADPPARRMAALSNLSRNAAKNIGDGALLPSVPRKRSGR